MPDLPKPPGPAETLRRELRSAGLTQDRFAGLIGVKRLTVNQLCQTLATGGQRRSVTPEMALRLEAATGLFAHQWMDLQRDLDLWLARRRLGKEIAAITKRVDVALGLRK